MKNLKKEARRLIAAGQFQTRFECWPKSINLKVKHQHTCNLCGGRSSAIWVSPRRLRFDLCRNHYLELVGTGPTADARASFAALFTGEVGIYDEY